MDGMEKPATKQTFLWNLRRRTNLGAFRHRTRSIFGPKLTFFQGCRGSEKPSVTFRFVFKRMAALSTLRLMVFWKCEKCRVDMSSISHDLQVFILVRWWRDFWTIKSSWSWNGTSIFRYKDAPTMANHKYHRSFFFWEQRYETGLLGKKKLPAAWLMRFLFGWKVLSWLVEFTTQLKDVHSIRTIGSNMACKSSLIKRI